MKALTGLRVAGKTFPAADVRQLSLLDVLELQAALRDNPQISRARTMQDVLRLFGEFASVSKAEQKTHPEGLFLTCVTLWATRRKGGERIGFLDAIDVTPGDYEWLYEDDGKEPEPEGKALRGSVPAAGIPRDRQPKKTKTSKTP